MNAKELIARYVTIRDKKAELKAEYDQKVAKYDTALNMIEAAFLKTFNATGGDSFKTPAGTAYVSTTMTATVADRDTFLHSFVIPQGAWEFLENRVSKAATEQYVADKKAPPPGVNIATTRKVNIRRPA